MNISQEVREKIQLLSPGERIKHYLKMLTEKKITKTQYDDILEAIKSVSYIPIVPQGSEIRGDTGVWHGRTTSGIREDSVSTSDGKGRGIAPKTSEQNTDTPTVECTSEEFISGLADVPTVSREGGKKDDKSQKQKLLTFLSDHEWKTTPQIQVAVYGANHLGVARIAPRILDLKNDGHNIESRKVTQSIWEYRLVEEGMKWITENIASG